MLAMSASEAESSTPRISVLAEYFTKNLSSPSLYDHFLNSQTDLGPPIPNWFAEFANNYCDLSDTVILDGFGQSLRDAPVDINRSKTNDNVCKENLDESSFTLGQQVTNRTVDKSSSFESPNASPCRKKTPHFPPTPSDDSFRPLSTSVRLRKSLGVDISHHLDWSQSMETPLCSKGLQSPKGVSTLPVKDENFSSVSINQSSTFIDTFPTILPFSPSTLKQCNERSEEKLEDSLSSTLSFLFQSPLARRNNLVKRVQESAHLNSTFKTNHNPKDSTCILSDSSIQILNEFSTCAKRANQDIADCEISLTKHFSSLISESVTEVLFNNTKFDFEDNCIDELYNTGIPCTSTPARLMKDKAILSVDVSPVTVREKNSEHVQTDSSKDEGFRSTRKSGFLTNFKANNKINTTETTCLPKHKAQEKLCGRNYDESKVVIGIESAYCANETTSDKKHSFTKSSVVGNGGSDDATYPIKDCVTFVDSDTRKSLLPVVTARDCSSPKPTHSAATSKTKEKKLVQSDLRKNRLKSKLFSYPTSSQIIRISDIPICEEKVTGSSFANLNNDGQLIKVDDIKQSILVDFVTPNSTLPEPAETIRKQNLSNITPNPSNYTMSQLHEVKNANEAFSNLVDDSWSQIDASNSHSNNVMNENYEKIRIKSGLNRNTPGLPIKRSVPKRLFNQQPNSRDLSTSKCDSELVVKESISELTFLNRTESELDGFKTAKGTDIKQSETSLKRAANVFSEDKMLISGESLNDIETRMCGFKTARGKDIKISETSFKRVTTLLADDDMLVDVGNVGVVDRMCISESGDCDSTIKDLKCVTMPMQGFRKACGRDLVFSNKQLEIAERIFGKVLSETDPIQSLFDAVKVEKNNNLFLEHCSSNSSILAPNSQSATQPDKINPMDGVLKTTLKNVDNRQSMCQENLSIHEIVIVSDFIINQPNNEKGVSKASLKRTRDKIDCEKSDSSTHSSSRISSEVTESMTNDSCNKAQELVVKKSICDNLPTRGIPDKYNDTMFKLASGKVRKISEAALNAAKKLFSDCDADLESTNDDLFQTGNEKLAIASKKEKSTCLQNSSAKTSDYSENPAKKVKLTAIGNTKENRINKISKLTDSMTKYNGIQSINCEKSVNMSEPLLKVSSNQRKSSSVKFATPDNQTESLTQSSINNLLDTCNKDTVFESISCNDEVNVKHEPLTSLNISKLLPSHTAKIGQNEFGAFKTSIGKSVSEAAITLSKQLPNDNNDISDCTEFGLLCSEGKKHCPTDNFTSTSNSIKTASKLTENNNSDQCKETTNIRTHGNDGFSNQMVDLPIRKFCGFQTASDKAALISESALKAAKHISTDKNDCSRNILDFNMLTNSMFESHKLSPIPESPDNVVDHVVPDIQNNSFEAFPTSENTILLSESDMNVVLRDVPDDFNCTRSDSIPVINKQSFCGFQTAAGKLAPVSNSALNAAKQILKEATCSSDTFDIFPHNISNISRRNFSAGFQTAAGKPTSVSETVLNSTKEMLKDDFDFPQDISNIVNRSSPDSCINIDERKPFSGFQTAAGKPAPISESALNAAKQFLNDVSDSSQGILNIDNIKPFGAFQTAAGNPSKVSESALNAAQQFLNNVSDSSHLISNVDNIKPFGGFQTAAGKPAPISESALNAAKQIFNNAMDTTKNISDINNGKSFAGFHTATGKSIEISESALISSKQILNEISDSSDTINKESDNRSQSTSDVTDTLITDNKDDFKPDELARTKVSVSKELLTFASNESFSDMEDPKNCEFASKKKDKRLYTISAQITAREVETDLPIKKSKVENFDPAFDTQEWMDENYLAYIQLVQDQEISIHSKLQKGIIPGKIWKQRNDKSLKRIKMIQAVGSIRPRISSLDELLSCGVKVPTMNVTSDNAEEFCFTRDCFEVSFESTSVVIGDDASLILPPDGVVGKEEFARAFLASPGVDPSLIDKAWIYNHFRWIVWKLSALECSFPKNFSGRALTPDNVMFQLKYRYDKEIDNSQRSALKKIIERDETPAKSLVLCIATIKLFPIIEENLDEDKETHKTSMCVELTDGWYSLKAVLDPALNRMVESGRIRVGQKLITCGAELIGCDTACPPLEVPETLGFRISANSTRVALWNTRLGFRFKPQPFPISIASILPDGGLIGCLQALVSRVFPLQYLERYPDGSTVIRTWSAETKATAVHEKLRSAILEKIVAKVQKDFENEEERKVKKAKGMLVKRKLGSKDVKVLNCGEELHVAMEASNDPSQFQNSLSCYQMELLRNYEQRHSDAKQEALQTAVRAAIAEKEALEELPKDRQVTPVLKVRLCDVAVTGKEKQALSILSIWNPSESIQELLREGQMFRIYHLLPRPAKFVQFIIERSRQNELQLSTTKRTRYEQTEMNLDTLKEVYLPRKVLLLSELSQSFTLPASVREVDIVGMVFKVQTLPRIVYLTDQNHKMAALHFKATTQGIYAESFLSVGKVIVVCNLHVPTHGSQEVMTLYTTEFSLIVVNPKKDDQRGAIQDLKRAILNVDQLVQSSNDLLNNKIESQKASVLGTSISKAQSFKGSVTPTVRRRYPQYSPVYTLPHPPVSRRTVSDRLVIKSPCEVEPGSPAESLRQQVREKISILDKLSLNSPVPELPSPSSTLAKKPFRVPLKQDYSKK